MAERTGRGVLVTGGSGGIGQAIARVFAEQGDRVVVHYATRRKEAEQVVAELPGEGHLALGADLTDPEAVRRLVDQSVAALDTLDVVVNNAGIEQPHHPILDCSYERWQEGLDRMIATMLTGPANVIYCAVQHMRGRGGRVVNISSRGAFRGEPHIPGYAAAKAGLNALGQSLAMALGGEGISVATVAPGFVSAGMADPILAGEQGPAIRAQSSFGRVATAEEVAHAVLYLASEHAEFASGTIIDLNGASYLRT